MYTLRSWIWKAATAMYGEKSKSRATWVRKALVDLLASKTDKVIECLEEMVEKRRLSKAKTKQVQKTIT